MAASIARKLVSGKRYIVLGDFNRSFAFFAELASSPAAGDGKQRSLGDWIDDGSFSAAPVVVSTAGLRHPAGSCEPSFSSSAIQHIDLEGGSQVARSPDSADDPLCESGDRHGDHGPQEDCRLYSDRCVVAADAKF